MSVRIVDNPSVTNAAESLEAIAAEQVDHLLAGVEPEPRSHERPHQANFDGLTWKHLPSFKNVFDATPAAAWADPASRGWECVKRNSARSVWRAEIGGAAYYLKYYAHDGLVERLKKRVRGPACEIEWRTGLYAREVGLYTVQLVGVAAAVRCEGRMCSLLVTEAIEPARPLSDFWRLLQSDDDAARRRRDKEYLTELLAEMIAHAHQSGFEHCDMHAANILVHTSRPGRYATVFVDLQSARLGVPLSDRAVVRNLAQLNQWFRRHASMAERLRFLRRYIRYRHEYETICEHARPLGMSFDELVAALSDEADRHAERLWAKRDRRARRSNKYFAKVRLGGGWRANVFLKSKRTAEESPVSAMELGCDWWCCQMSSPLRMLDQKDAALRKDSHSASVVTARLSCDSGEIDAIVKRPLARNWRRKLRNLLGLSRSARGWRLANALLNRDIATARPLAMLERRLGPLVLDSVLLTEFVPGAVDLAAHLKREFERLGPRQWLRHKLELCDLLARALRQLTERGFTHRDCKAQNLLVVAEPRLKLIWIDMDGLRLTRRPSVERQMKTLARLNVSLIDAPGITLTDRVRFLRTYLAGFGRDPRAWRGVWRRIAGLSDEKLAALEKRREWKRKHYGRE